MELLLLFLMLRLAQHLAERYLAFKNKQYYTAPEPQERARKALDIPSDEMNKALHYSLDKFQFGSVSSWVGLICTLGFLAAGGLGWAEQLALQLSDTTMIQGLLFIGILGLLSSLLSLPFDIYHTFVLEERHGFNKQTVKGFILDRIKGALLGVIIGGALLSVIFYLMESLEQWWLWAWFTVFGFNLLIAWIYPTLLAPLFNKFSPLEEGELKTKLLELARRVHFDAGSISVMNASIRSSHGNAYFTGVFGKKKIVLFDTLIEAMKPDEICAVLAHELGHFKLHHIRWTLIRSFFLTGFVFWLLFEAMRWDQFYLAFDLKGVSPYGALVVFSLWFGPISFLFQPFSTWLSRRNEFAADAFALDHIDEKSKLGDALLKLRQKSHGMPISHKAFSTVYHSHPPLLERLQAMGYSKPT